MSRRQGKKAQEKAAAQIAASATKAVVKAKSTKAQKHAAVIKDLQETIRSLQGEVYQLLLEKENWYGAPAETLSSFEDTTASEDVKFSVDELYAQNQALRAEVKRLAHQASSGAQNFAGAIASLNTEIERLRAELVETSERAEVKILRERERAAEDVYRAEKVAGAERVKLTRLLASIGSLVDDIATS